MVKGRAALSHIANAKVKSKWHDGCRACVGVRIWKGGWKMKGILKELAMFNVKAVFIFFVVGLIIYFLDTKAGNTKVALFLMLLSGWYLLGNLKIIYRSRRVIVDCFKRGSVEVAAGVIEFKEHASARAKERMREKMKSDSESR
ncbi:hypothetical protein ACNFIC_00665 [Pseudomonas sp. NY15463]|uniref:hypothetical protein n=1 Tax=Pseudomonas sp. NY15463 TaxID=3400361 RepID=UPI003A85BB17